MSEDTILPAVDNASIAPTSGTTSTTQSTESNSFISSLPEEFRSNPSVSKFKDPLEVVKSYINLEKELGGRIKIPAEDAAPEERAAFYQKLGRPETIEGYDYSEIMKDHAQVFEAVPSLKDTISNFSKQAYELGLSKKAAAEIVNAQTKMLESQYTERLSKAKEEVKAAETLLSDTWKHDLDVKKSDAKLVATKLSQKYPEQWKALANSDAGRNPLVMLMLADLANQYKEDKIIGDTKLNFSDTKQSAMDKISAIKADNSHPFWNERDPKHMQAVSEYNQLAAMAYSKG